MNSQNIKMIQEVAKALQELNKNVVLADQPLPYI
jgi:hypothetical protein